MHLEEDVKPSSKVSLIIALWVLATVIGAIAMVLWWGLSKRAENLNPPAAATTNNAGR